MKNRLKINQLPKCECPSCGHKLDAAKCITDAPTAQPEPGDFTLCIECGELLRFNHDLTLREASDEDEKELDSEQIQIMQIQIMMALEYVPPKLHPEEPETRS